MTFAQYVSTGSVRTGTRKRGKDTELVGIKVSGAHGLLLQTQAHAVASAACALYLLIGDPQQTQSESQSRQCGPAEVATRPNGVDYRATDPFATDPEEDLINRVVGAKVSIDTASMQYSRCQLAASRADLDALVGVLVAVAQETKAMVSMLQYGCAKARLSPVIAGIRALEQHGDKVCGRAIAHLQDDAIANKQAVAQWREIYASVARAIRQCRWVADAVENLPQFASDRQRLHRRRSNRATPQIVH